MLLKRIIQILIIYLKNVNKLEKKTIKWIVENYGLFIVENGFFWSETLKTRMKELDEIKLKRAIAGRKGGQAKANAKQNKAKAKQNKAEERKGEKRKENNIGESLLCKCGLIMLSSFFNKNK